MLDELLDEDYDDPEPTHSEPAQDDFCEQFHDWLDEFMDWENEMMLVLTRKSSPKQFGRGSHRKKGSTLTIIVPPSISPQTITVSVFEIKEGGEVRLGLDADRSIRIIRDDAGSIEPPATS